MRVLALLTLALVGLWPLPASAQAIKVGAVVPVTGRDGGGAEIRAGYEIAVLVQWINGKQELVGPKESASAPLASPAPPFAKR